jgi:hypothetical protein
VATGKSYARFVLRAIPLVLVGAAVFELLAAIAAWGAANHVEIPGWEPTFVGICFALPGIALGLIAFRAVTTATRDGFGVSWVFFAAGVAALVFAVVVEIALAVVIADSSTYDHLRDSDGTINTSPGGFLFAGIGAAIVIGIGLMMPAFLYTHSITTVVHTRFDRMADEPDAVGEMLRGGRRGRR